MTVDVSSSCCLRVIACTSHNHGGAQSFSSQVCLKSHIGERGVIAWPEPSSISPFLSCPGERCLRVQDCCFTRPRFSHDFHRAEKPLDCPAAKRQTV